MASFNPADFLHPEFLVKEIEPGFINLQFNNPKTLNAFSESTWRGYQDLLEKIDKLADIKVILISSPIEKAFTSGLNLKAAASLMNPEQSKSQQETFKELRQHIIEFQYAIDTPTRIKTPTICLLNGVCYGLAIDIASATSIRIVTKDARLSIREIKIGIVSDMGTLQRAPHIVGNLSKLNQYALTGEIFNGDDALELGLVSKVFPDYKSAYEHCIELGTEINTAPQWAVRGTKHSIKMMTRPGLVDEGFEQIADYQGKYLAGMGEGPKL